MMPKLPLISILLISWQACLAQVPSPEEFSVSVVDQSGKAVKGAQVCVVSKDGIFQKGVADNDGKVTFKTPPKSSFVFAAAPEHESEKISYSGQPTVKITIKESTTRSSAIAASSTVELIGKGGSISPYRNFMDCSGIVFKNGGRSTFAVNMPVHAIDTSGRAFNIYIKEQYPPVFLVEYTH